jgi:hypothetical protein
MFKLIVTCLSLLWPAIAFAAPTTQPASDWKPLFNGKDFSGWYTYLLGLGKDRDPAKVFSIEDNAIHVYKDALDGSQQTIGFLSSKDSFGDCRIQLEYKWGTKRFGSYTKARRDAGLLYFVASEDGAFTPGRPWPICMEFQIRENDTGDAFAVGTQVTTTIDPTSRAAKWPTYQDGGVSYTTPLAGNKRLVHSEIAEKDGWNTVELVLQGDTAAHIVNGKTTMRVTHVGAPAAESGGMISVRKGRILLQAEGSEVWYRNISYQPLKNPR